MLLHPVPLTRSTLTLIAHFQDLPQSLMMKLQPRCWSCRTNNACWHTSNLATEGVRGRSGTVSEPPVQPVAATRHCSCRIQVHLHMPAAKEAWSWFGIRKELQADLHPEGNFQVIGEVGCQSADGVSVGQQITAGSPICLPRVLLNGDCDSSSALRCSDCTRLWRHSCTCIARPICSIRYGWSLHPTSPPAEVIWAERLSTRVVRIVYVPAPTTRVTSWRSLSNDDHPVRRATGQCTWPDAVRTADVVHLVEQYGFRVHQYADDTQLYGCCQPGNSALLYRDLSICVDDVAQWMRSNRLQLNAGKTEFIQSTNCSISLSRSVWVGPRPRRVSWQVYSDIYSLLCQYVNAHACHTTCRFVLRCPMSTAQHSSFAATSSTDDLLHYVKGGLL